MQRLWSQVERITGYKLYNTINYDNPDSGGGGFTVWKYKCRKCGHKWKYEKGRAV